MVDAPSGAEVEAIEQDEDELSPEDALATAIEQLRGVAGENEVLRAELAEHRRKEIALREANRELEWRCRAGGGAGSERGAAAMADEWRDMEQRVQVLITENGLLENAQVDTQVALQREQANAIELQNALSEALGAAQRSREAQLAAEEEARKAHAATAVVRERLREQELLAAGEASAVKQLKHELEAARAEAANAHRDAIAVGQRVEKQHAAAALAAGAAAEREGRGAEERGRLQVELEAAQRRAAGLEVQLSEARATERQQGALVEGLGGELEATRQALRDAQAQADEAGAALREAQARRAEADAARRESARRVEQSAALAESTHAGAAEGARASARGHAEALAEARAAAAREAVLAEQGRAELHGALAAAHAKAERETRERRDLQAQLDAASARLAAAEQAAAEQRAAAGGASAEELQERAARAHALADELRLELAEARAEARTERDSASRQRARAEGAEGEAEREQIKGRRATAEAEAARDAMAATMALRQQAADGALAEAAAAEARVQAERGSMHAFAEEQVGRLREQKETLAAQLAEATAVACRLQDLLASQQGLADAYREQARRALAQLRGAHDPDAAALGAGAGAASVPFDDAAADPAVLAELRAARARDEQSRRMLAAAALVVS